MGFIADTKYMLGNFSRVFNSRPSVVARQNRDRSMINAAFHHGIEIGARRRTMYGDPAGTGILRGDWNLSLQSASALIRKEHQKLCARAEGLYRTSPIIRRAISLFDTCVVGSGIRPYPAIRYANGEQPKSVNERLSNDWEKFVEQGVRNGPAKTNFYQSQSVEFKTMAVYGSCLTNIVNSKPGSLLPYAFQFLKPTRLDFSKDTLFDDNNLVKPNSKKIIHGIEINDYADAIGFYLENEGRYDSDRMMLSFFPIETEQYLGLTWLYPVMCSAWDVEQLFSDKMNQSRIGSRLGVKLSKEDRVGVEQALGQSDNGSSYMDFDFQGFYMGKDKPEPISMTDPISDTFKALVDMNMAYIAMGMGFSYSAFTTDLSGANFSGMRQNLIGDNRTFTCVFKKLIDISEKAKWNKFVEWEVITGRLAEFGVTPTAYYKDPSYYNQSLWLPMDYQEWVDPLKDQQALILAYKTGQITFRELCARSGKNLSTQIKELEEERKDLIAAGLQHLLPENINMSTKAAPAEQNEPVKENEDE